MKLPWKKVLFGFFTVSITKWDGWSLDKQGGHFLIHFLPPAVTAFIFPDAFIAMVVASFLGAFLIEIWDGLKKNAVEGFNIFPDLTVRVLSALLGFGVGLLKIGFLA